MARPARADVSVAEGYTAIWNSTGTAVKLMLESLTLDPGSPERWTDLAEAMYETGRMDDARYCEQQALNRAPGMPHIETRAAGMYFRLGDRTEALRLTGGIFQQTHEYDGIVFQMWQRLGGPADDIYDIAVGSNATVGRDYFNYLAQSDDSAATAAAWKVLQAKRMVSPPESRSYVAALTAAHEYDRAASVQSEFLPEILDNSGFESEWTEHGPGWHVESVAGVSVSRDLNIRNGGSASLRMEFDGASHDEFHHISQTKVLPAGKWHLRAMLRTDLKGPGYQSGPAATAGVGMRVVDSASGRVLAMTSTLNVTRDWTPVDARFTIGPHAQLVRIEVVRPASPLSTLGMTGTAWADDVKLFAEAAR